MLVDLFCFLQCFEMAEEVSISATDSEKNLGDEGVFECITLKILKINKWMTKKLSKHAYIFYLYAQTSAIAFFFVRLWAKHKVMSQDKCPRKVSSHSGQFPSL